MREKFAIVFAIILVCGLCQATTARRGSNQKPHKENTNEIIRQELERFRGLYAEEHERCAREMEARKALEFQLMKLRSAVAKAAKL